MLAERAAPAAPDWPTAALAALAELPVAPHCSLCFWSAPPPAYVGRKSQEDRLELLMQVFPSTSATQLRQLLTGLDEGSMAQILASLENGKDGANGDAVGALTSHRPCSASAPSTAGGVGKTSLL